MSNNNIPNAELKLAVGTVSEQKLGYLREVLYELCIEAEIFPHQAASGVSDQPLTSQETLAGAVNRAAAALNAVPEADFGIGLEVGYDSGSDGRYGIFCWAVVLDQAGQQAQARSHSFLLPQFHQSVLEGGEYLGERVREYFAVATDPVTQYVAEAVRGRKLFITESLRYALIYALHREFYKSDQ
jgi:non-canonical (house-cleaning) NTP pyrophosphatase